MPQLIIEQAFQTATRHHQAGQLRQAEDLYRQILASQPNHVGAMHYLGMLVSQAGQIDLAINLIRQAVALQPDYAQAYNSLGVVLGLRRDFNEAIAAYRQAIVLKPDLAEAHNNLGNALTEKGRLDEAVKACRQAIALRPNFAEAHNNLGNVLTKQGHLDDAIAACLQASTLQPNSSEVYNNLAIALRDKGLMEQSVSACHRAIALRPDFAEAFNNLGIALKDNGELEEAIIVYRRAIALRPDLAEAYNNLGYALADKGQLDEAITAYRQALAIRPQFAEAHGNLGNALKDQGQLDEAIAAYRQALALKPHSPEAGSNLIYLLHLHPGYSAQTIAEEAFRWSRQHAELLEPQIQRHANDRDPERRIRIGYVSADFREHACAHLLLPLLEHHDIQKFEIFCYSQVPRPDGITRRMQQLVTAWRSIVGLSDAQVAAKVSEDRIDVLVDLSLHTAGNRLLVFARKPAPVQASWMLPITTGLRTIDYRLTDPIVDPAGLDDTCYSEQSIRLPDTYWCYDPLDGRNIPVNSLPALENGIVTFGCLCHFSKINQIPLTLWAAVLRQVKDSRLLLLSNQGSHVQRTLDRLCQEGIDPERVEFLPRQSRQTYLDQYHRIDLALDTLPYNGHTTNFDSFWMGVPVVTLVGQTACGRVGASQLTNLGLPELIARTSQQYVQTAVNLAGDLHRLAELRRTLRPRMEASTLMDAPRFARNMESAYRQMWRTWCSNSELDSVT